MYSLGSIINMAYLEAKKSIESVMMNQLNAAPKTMPKGAVKLFADPVVTGPRVVPPRNPVNIAVPVLPVVNRPAKEAPAPAAIPVKIAPVVVSVPKYVAPAPAPVQPQAYQAPMVSPVYSSRPYEPERHPVIFGAVRYDATQGKFYISEIRGNFDSIERSSFVMNSFGVADPLRLMQARENFMKNAVFEGRFFAQVLSMPLDLKLNYDGTLRMLQQNFNQYVNVEKKIVIEKWTNTHGNL